MFARPADSTDFLDARLFETGVPHALYEQLRAHAPVSQHTSFDGDYWLFTRYADVRAALLDTETYSSSLGTTQLRNVPADQREMLQYILINMDPPAHTRYRRLITRAFASRAVEKMEVRAREITANVLDRVVRQGRCDFVADIAAPLPIEMIAELVGVPVEHRERLLELSNLMIGLDDPDFAGDPDTGMRAALEMYSHSDALATERRAHPQDDLMSLLVSAEVDGERLTDGEINAFFLLLIVAGNETTRNLLSGGLLALFENPAERARLMADRSLMPSAVEEMLRYVSPVMQFRRTASRDTVIHGQTVREGDRVILAFASANRDEQQFANASRFDVGRSPNAHVSFGYGAHLCLGAALARLETRVMLEALFQRTPDISADGPVRRLQSTMINGTKSLPVKFTPTP